MTEYDFSPEAYSQHLATQARIARWAHDTHTVPQKDPFTPPTPAGSTHIPLSRESSKLSHGSSRREPLLPIPDSSGRGSRRTRSSDRDSRDRDRDREGRDRDRDRARSSDGRRRHRSRTPPPPLPSLPPLPSPRGQLQVRLQPPERPQTAPPRPIQRTPTPYYPPSGASVYSVPPPQAQPQHRRTRSSSQSPSAPVPGPVQLTRTRSYSVTPPPPPRQPLRSHTYPYAPPMPAPPGYTWAAQPAYPNNPSPTYAVGPPNYPVYPVAMAQPQPVRSPNREVPLLKRVFGFGGRKTPRRSDSY
ncbi:hypothetical protein DFH07DRAFT_966597 [Mycena maculata]|uniref:Uncharacterized protein n=1 Tax=Mycena maculata TaxID=230809 RepID=A0AAD7I809_9AGAR|nr:hypothetical protein DFH07DRAFT_966597 [Mycena maculata]